MIVPIEKDGLLITNPTNIRYLTGFVGVENRDAYVLITRTTTYFFTSSLYAEQVKHLSPIILSAAYPITQALTDISVQKIEFESDNLTYAEYARLVASGFTLTPTKNKIEALREIKTKQEIQYIKRAASVTDQCFSFILNRIKPGITESRLAWEIESYLRVKGGDLAFSPIVAFNTNSSQPHYVSRGNSPLRKKSLILLDFGAKVNGYCADMTRVIFLGSPKPEWINAYNAVLAANKKAIDMLTKGERNGATLDAAAQRIIVQTGLPVYPHSLGHAVGLDIHEAPRLTVKKPETLKTDMVVTVEPGVYIEGSYGIRIEDLVLLTDKGIYTLSRSQKELTIV